MKTVIFLYFEQLHVIIELTHRLCILVTLLEDCWMHKGRDQLFSMKTSLCTLPKEMRAWKWSRMCLKENTAELRRIYLPDFLLKRKAMESWVFGDSFYCFLYRFHVVLQLCLRFPKTNFNPFKQLGVIQKQCTNSQYTYWLYKQGKKPAEENKWKISLDTLPALSRLACSAHKQGQIMLLLHSAALPCPILEAL